MLGYTLKWMLIGQLVLVLFFYINIALWAGEYIDSKCVEGRFSEEQALAHNSIEWGGCPSYRMKTVGRCIAGEGDRVVKSQCSDFMRTYTGRNNPTLKRIKKAFSKVISEDST